MGKKYEELPEYYQIYKKEQGWYERVKSPKTGDFNQAEDLIRRESVTADWTPPRTSKGKAVKYPIHETSELIRKRLVDGTEWLLSRQMWYGLDSLGNEVNISMNDKEKYDETRPQYVLRPEDPKANPQLKNTKMVRTIDRLERNIKYTLPFNAKEAQRLYDMKNGKISLCVIDESGGVGDHPPVTVPSFEHFKMPFQELWEMVTTPKYKMDRSYGDNLDNSHIG
ncbi:MAG: hypothetical protein ACRD42_05215 [Nitrososphaeraceae archaeon]